MTILQKVFMWCGVLVIVAMCIMPPWHKRTSYILAEDLLHDRQLLRAWAAAGIDAVREYGKIEAKRGWGWGHYRLIVGSSGDIDLCRLSIQVFAVALITGAGIVSAGKGRLQA